MGQYHQTFAVTDDGAVHRLQHYPLGCGAKLLEQAWSGSPFVAALSLLVTAGPWQGARLVTVGDYAEPGDNFGQLADFEPWGWYGREDVVDDTDLAVQLLAEATGITFVRDGWREVVRPEDWDDRVRRWRESPGEGSVLVALDVGESLSGDAFSSPANPLFSGFDGSLWGAALTLLAASDGKGGGDARIDPPGRWAGTRLQVVSASDVPESVVDVSGWYRGQAIA